MKLYVNRHCDLLDNFKVPSCAQSCPTLCDSMDCSPGFPGSSVGKKPAALFIQVEMLGKQPYNRDREKTCLIREKTSTSREEMVFRKRFEETREDMRQ